ncbi:MAG: hypothetical protein QCI00_09025, partial [Candidatus Thermoplasmatota archaeon]|nr:hypothetical protein [Candidatus Thermoplasmatota archaeon]
MRKRKTLLNHSIIGIILLISFLSFIIPLETTPTQSMTTNQSKDLSLPLTPLINTILHDNNNGSLRNDINTIV